MSERECKDCMIGLMYWTDDSGDEYWVPVHASDLLGGEVMTDIEFNFCPICGKSIDGNLSHLLDEDDSEDYIEDTVDLISDEGEE